MRTHHVVAALFFLLVLDYCVFGSLIRQLGIYLDEWSFFHKLHFCGNSWFACLKTVVSDDRILIRPAYTPYLATAFYFFHENPLPYHICNQIFEIAGALFLYIALNSILKDKVLSFLAAALFLIYPSHDLTHYSIGAASTTIAVTLFNLSLWLFAKGLESKQQNINEGKPQQSDRANLFICLSALVFLIGLLNYEICLSLFVIYTAVATIILWKKHRVAKTLALAALYTTPSFAAIVLVVLFRSVFLPSLKMGWGYRTVFDPVNFFHVIYEGIRVSISPYAFSFFLALARDQIREGFNLFQVSYLVIASAVLIFAGWVLAKGSPEDESNLLQSSKLAIALGLLILISAYILFAMSPDYLPVLDTGVNRINTASSIGAAMLIAGFFGWLTSFIKMANKQNQSIIFAGLLVPFVLLFTLADWQFARPWIVSWRAQKQVIDLIKRRSPQLHSGDTIILAGLPRYVMWAPVFDGVWDFQSALRINLNRHDINGGVLSDRMVITPDFLEDRFQKYLCSSYPLQQIYILVPNLETWIPIHSSQEFIDTAKRYNVTVTRDQKSFGKTALCK